MRPIVVVLILVHSFCSTSWGARLNNYYKPVGHVRTDPIVAPKCLSDHVHTFYGPQALFPDTTTDELLSLKPSHDTGNTEENMSLYWHPTIYRYDPVNNVYHREDDIMYLAAYYYWEKRSDLVAFPKDFKMIAYRNHLVPGEFRGAMECVDDDGNLKHGNEKDCIGGGDCYTESTFFPSAYCRYFEFTMTFPICWNGELDSPDHRSHVAYTTDGTLNGPCPGTHSAGRFPLISLFVSIERYKGGWYLFSDGTDMMHADYMSGWDPAFLQHILDNCDTDILNNCDDYLSFKGNTKDAPLYPRPEELEKVQPHTIYDTFQISPENTKKLDGELILGACTGTLYDRNGNEVSQPMNSNNNEEEQENDGCDDLENDVEFQYHQNPSKDCDWVANDPDSRCYKQYDGEFLYDFCPVSCCDQLDESRI